MENMIYFVNNFKFFLYLKMPQYFHNSRSIMIVRGLWTPCKRNLTWNTEKTPKHISMEEKKKRKLTFVEPLKEHHEVFLVVLEIKKTQRVYWAFVWKKYLHRDFFFLEAIDSQKFIHSFNILTKRYERDGVKVIKIIFSLFH